ncbi:hypothetical protein EV127DRAFT_354901 [Xylaria flabelliformis]|nr:hypothetical protein EV127DRAFT_354901 [Xylaria flabelliformis]
MRGPILPTPEEAAWQLVRPQDSFVTSIVAASAICSALATVFVGLRICRLSKQALKPQIFISSKYSFLQIFFYGTETVIAVATLYGLGRHVVFIKDTRLVFIVGIISLIVSRSKLSHRTKARIAVGFSLREFLPSCNNCIPISASWDLTIKGTCINVGLFALFLDLSNIVSDFVILAMPVPLVLKLQVSRQEKRMLIATFATGGSAYVISIILLKYISKLSSKSDSTWNNAPVAIVVSVECMIGFLAISIATYRPLYRYLFMGTGLPRVTPTGYRTLMEEPCSAHISAGERPLSKNLISQVCHNITATNEIELVYYVDCGGVWIRVDNDGTDMYK